ncbi:organic cation transporter 1 [Asbolus verrucosus]|uniref:Organic cation transporter 1 n=1 Tax=Asbolus verrucosus TaxID=1661398 RepID=A0A482W3W3_ASBVE|nr:organic cation transporter 1 [Asbolus verrucosus]
MFNRTNYTADNNEMIDCIYGWEFDTTYYTQTIATQENWVCSQKMHVTNFLVYGRRPVFYASIITLIIGRLGLIMSRGIYSLFIAFSIIGSLPSLAIFQAPLVISVEISSIEDRTFIPLLQCIGWTAGLCIAPMIFWALGEWISFTLITTLPLILFLFISRYMIESPRWLASKGKMKKCVKELKRIAKLNNSEVSDKVLMSLNKETIKPEKNFGVMSLFSSWNLAKKSILIITGWLAREYDVSGHVIIISGISENPSYPYIIAAVLAVLGGISGIFLPETLNKKLPETVSEAEQFGADQKLWSLPKGKKYTHEVVTNAVI